MLLLMTCFIALPVKNTSEYFEGGIFLSKIEK